MRLDNKVKFKDNQTMGITDFFSKKEGPKRNSEEILKEKILKVKLMEQQINVRAKKPVKKVVPKAPPIPSTPLSFETLTFYGNPIRKVYFKNHWYFPMEDVIAITGLLDLEKYIVLLKKSKEYKESLFQYVVPLPTVDNGQTNTIDCIDTKGLAWLLPILREAERFFPGPFPSWIAHIK